MLKKKLGELAFFLDRLRSPVLSRRLHLLSSRSQSTWSDDEETRALKLGNFKGFIFDLDGLVLDTEPTYFAAWQQAVAAMGYQLEPEAFKLVSGFNYKQVETQLKTWLGQDFDVIAFKRLGTELWRKLVREQGIAIKPGVVELLDYTEQKGIPICLATNSWGVYARHCLAIAGLEDRFPLIISGDEVTNVKPAPEIFLKAADLMQIAIHECVIFEDSHTGITAASASGAYSVFVPSTFPVNPQAVELANCVLDDLTQVFETLPRRAPIRI